MASLKSGVFYIKGTKFEKCEPHVTRLSLNFNLDNTQPYFIGNREFHVSPSRFLLINEGQSFTTLSANTSESRMVTVAFKVGLADELYHVFSSSHDKLLSSPFATTPRRFFEQTYAVDETMRKNVEKITSESAMDESELQEELNGILLRVMLSQTDIWKHIESIDKTKASTRQEIYRRMQNAYEFLHNNFHNPIQVEDLASEACLSTFHFKRLFREVYHQAPYQYIKSLRVQKARELLKQGLPVHEVCHRSGWRDKSAFIRLFKKEVGVTPDRYR
jgi:AraC family transcriptional regulator